MENDQNYFDTEVFEAKHIEKDHSALYPLYGEAEMETDRLYFICIAFYTYFTVMAPLNSADVVDLIWNQMKEAMHTGQHFQITWEFGGRQLFSLLLMFLACGIFYSLQSFLMASFAEKLNLQLRGEISEKLNRLPLSYFDRQQPGAIMSRATNDLEKMSEALQTGLLRLFMAVGTILGSLSIMLTLTDSSLRSFCSSPQFPCWQPKPLHERPCAMRPDARIVRDGSTALSKKPTAAVC